MSSNRIDVGVCVPRCGMGASQVAKVRLSLIWRSLGYTVVGHDHSAGTVSGVTAWCTDWTQVPLPPIPLHPGDREPIVVTPFNPPRMEASSRLPKERFFGGSLTIA